MVHCEIPDSQKRGENTIESDKVVRETNEQVRVMIEEGRKMDQLVHRGTEKIYNPLS